jgi:hypothetical protein
MVAPPPFDAERLADKPGAPKATVGFIGLDGKSAQFDKPRTAHARAEGECARRFQGEGAA